MKQEKHTPEATVNTPTSGVVVSTADVIANISGVVVRTASKALRSTLASDQQEQKALIDSAWLDPWASAKPKSGEN